MTDKKQDTGDEDVNLLEWGHKIWMKRKFIAVVVSVFLMLGVGYAFMAPLKYDSATIFITQSGEQNKVPGSLGGLASLAGVRVNLGDNDSGIPASLYSKVAHSIPFFRKLVKVPLKTSNGSIVTYDLYYDSLYQKSPLELIAQYTLGLPSYILGSRDSKTVVKEKSDWLKLGEKEKDNFDRVLTQLSINVNDLDGYISLQFSMDDPALATQMAKAAFDLLQQELIEYKTQKAQESFDFTEESFKEKRNEFFDVQNRLAEFKDNNKNLTSAKALNQLERLQADYDLKFRLYSELASQLEQVKLELNKEKPVFFVIQPVSEPLLKTSPKRKNIVIVFFLAGFLVSVALVLIRKTLINTWRQIRGV